MIVKGIVHCHSELSYDCKTTIGELRDFLAGQGLQFVALTDHDRDVTAEGFRDFAARCLEQSDADFVVIPGIEVRCSDGAEIAGLGVRDLPERGTPERVVQRIRELGGYGIWVHPRKRKRPIASLLESDAIEVLNGKLDGTLAPDLSLVRLVRKERAGGRVVHAIFGLDMHDELQPRSVWIECDTSELGAEAIVDSLRRGRFVNRTRWGRVNSDGTMSASSRISHTALRWASRGFDGLLSRLSGRPRSALVAVSRPIVRLLKPRVG